MMSRLMKKMFACRTWRTVLNCVVLLGVMAGCNYSDEPRQITLNNRYQIEIPTYMRETNELNPNADFQYQNQFRNRYLIIFQKPKNNSLQVFAKQRTNKLLQNVRDSVVTKSSPTEINDVPCYEKVISAKVGKERIYYKLMFYEGKEYFYQLVIWTRDDKLAPFKQDIETIAKSFQQAT